MPQKAAPRSCPQRPPARRAKARAAADAAKVVPLLRDSWSRTGGMQGLAAIEELLRTDGDGDTAHEFWEAVGSGCFQLVEAAQAVESPSGAM